MKRRAAAILEFARGAVSRNLGLKALALAIAVALWWFVAGESSVQYGFSVPIELRRVPAGMAITNAVERRVDVRVAGPATLIGTLPRDDVTAVIDLSGARPGRTVYPLTATSITLPSGVRVVRITPDSVEVALAKLERRRLPVSARIVGSARLKGRIARITVDPAEVEVEGLPEDFSRLKTLWTEDLAPDAARGVFSARARVELPEGRAKIVGNSTVRVTVQFRP
ncbi:MAG: YbbR-like domain-containing protein [Gemmatimonadota bacterium]